MQECSSILKSGRAQPFFVNFEKIGGNSSCYWAIAKKNCCGCRQLLWMATRLGGGGNKNINGQFWSTYKPTCALAGGKSDTKTQTQLKKTEINEKKLQTACKFLQRFPGCSVYYWREIFTSSGWFSLCNYFLIGFWENTGSGNKRKTKKKN